MGLIRDELSKINLNKFNNKKIALMGRLEHVKEMVECLSLKDVSTTYIYDNDPNKSGCFLDNIRILPPDRYDGNTVVIIYSPRHWEDMKNQLIGLGYEDEEDIIVIDRPCFEKAELKIRYGVDLLAKLKQEYGDDVFIFLLGCPLGDFYLLNLFLKSYCTKNNIKNYALVGTSLGIEKLSDLFEIKNRKTLTTEECNALAAEWKFLGTNETAMMPLTIWQGDFRFNPCFTRQKIGMTFMDTFRHMIFGLDDGVMPEYPRIKANREYTRKLFEDKGLQPGKTVVLVPYSYSIHSLPAKFWQLLAEKLVDLGFSVAVNRGEKRETEMIKGVPYIEEDFEHITDILEYSGYCIGIRCGFFDITSQTECKKIVLYHERSPQSVKWNRTDIDFCGLGCMGLDEDAVELEYNGRDEKTIEKIISYLER